MNEMKATEETIKKAKDLNVKLENETDLVEIELEYDCIEDAIPILSEMNESVKTFKAHHPNATFRFDFSEFEAYGHGDDVDVEEITICLVGITIKTEEELLEAIKNAELRIAKHNDLMKQREKEDYERLKKKFEGE